MTEPSPFSGIPAGESEKSQISLIRHYLDILRRRIWIIITFTVVFSCVGAVRAFRAPNIYRSSTVITIERQMPHVVSIDPTASDYAPWDPDFYSTQAQLILSQAVLELAVQDPLIARALGQYAEEKSPPLSERMKEIILAALGAPPTQTPKLWEKLASHMSAKPKGGTHLITISATARDPRTPAIFADGVARAFETFMLKSRTDLLGDAFSYLKDEKEREEEKYLSAENELQKFREESKDVDLGKESSPATDKLAALNSRLTELQLRHTELKSQLISIPQLLELAVTDPEKSYNQMLAVPIIKDDPGIQSVRQKITDTETSIAELSRIYGAEHPQIQEARTTLAALHQEFDVTVQRTLLLQQNILDGIMAEESELTRQMEELKSVVLESAQGSFKMARLTSEVDRHRQIFDALVKSMLDVERSSGFDTTSVRKLQEASVSNTPISPDRRMDVIFSLLTGLGLGLALALLIETMDDTIKTPEDLRDKLDIPLLGFVPRIQAKTPDKKHQRIKTLFAVDEPVSSVAEAFRQIRTNIFYSLATDKAKVLVSTSCHPGEGKTTTICNLAAVIAQNGRRVLLIDGDFHRPNVHHVYGIKSGVGLVDVLGGTLHWKKAICTPYRNGRVLENIHIIPAGPSTAAASERLGSNAMKTFISEARNDYDWVLVDSPPLLFVSDASVLSALCDGIILVVKAGMNNRSLLLRTCNQLRQLKVEILGTILNQMVVSFMGRHYSYYYYHGYAHYAENYHKSYYGDAPEEETTAETDLHQTSNGTQASAATQVIAQPPPPVEPTHPVPRIPARRSSKDSKPRSASVDRKKSVELQAAFERWKSAHEPDTVYHIGQGDVLEITIPALRETDQRSTIRRSVDKKGAITLQTIGTLEAAGLTVDELVGRIVDTCRDRNVKDSEVSVSIVDHQSRPILIIGAVSKPGIHHLTADKASLLDVLIQSGGFTSKADITITVTHPGDVVPSGDAPTGTVDSPSTSLVVQETVSLSTLLDPAHPESNIRIEKGAIVRVTSGRDEVVHVLGLVQKPGAINMMPGTPVTACTALATSGGFATQDRTEPCFVIRDTPNGERATFEVQLSKIIYGEQPDVPLKPHDILIVGSRIFFKLFKPSDMSATPVTG